MRKLQCILTFITLFLAFQLGVSVAKAKAEISDVVRAVEKAYGGKKLKNLREFQIDDEYRETYRGQGYTTEYDNFWLVKSKTVLDLRNERGSYESWSDQYGRIMQFHTISTESGIANIDYREGNYGINPESTFYQSFGRVIRASDTLLAYELIKSERKKKLVGLVNYLGEKHYHVALEMPSSPTQNLYIDRSTGLIKRMHREFPDGGARVFYVFENHSSSGGIGFAREYRLFIDGELIFLTRKRSINTRKVNGNFFRLANGLVREPARFTVAKMQVQKLSENLHHVGQNSFTSFYDAGEYIIGLGGYGGLKNRFEAYQKAMGHKKPLRYQIPTHHHADHTEGLADALELGAKIVLSGKIKPKLLREISQLKEDRVVTFDKKYTLDGLKIFEIGTSHAQNMAVIYIPQAKAIFQEDHYAGSYAEKPNAATRNTNTFYQSVAPLKLDIEKLLSTHSGKIEAWSAIRKSIAGYSGKNCAFSRPICSS